ncbi:hypothetical protein WQQ_02340 [Hydrocarboniphaga effusa AP103]|uniref:Uncharacterized protein n=1 Tax=Hydrocarboniphaga effusa AP103 TaxID=1172194 RepID=I8T7H2_9GAMM|nr:hypothetical protein WQQ_00470 [Hydrocarboniphaga effusa AP103]EIT70097.1 hypothetical protein WQQ_02340 [Hydrocarboniphaga effusa AP103]
MVAQPERDKGHLLPDLEEATSPPGRGSIPGIEIRFDIPCAFSAGQANP